MALSDEKRQLILDLAKAGRGRNEIAKTVGCSGRTVSNIVKDAGMSFDRQDAIVATQARAADAKKRRIDLGADLLGDLEEARIRVGQTITAREFQQIAQGMDALMRAYVNLLKYEPDQDQMEVARGLLAGFFAAVQTTAEPMPDRMGE